MCWGLSVRTDEDVEDAAVGAVQVVRLVLEDGQERSHRHRKVQELAVSGIGSGGAKAQVSNLDEKKKWQTPGPAGQHL